MSHVNFALLVERFGEEGARSAFERLIAQLVRLEHEDARQVVARQGDEGLDVICGSLGGDVDVWQAKFFFPQFVSSDHRRKAEASLATACAARKTEGGRLRNWTLCIPSDLDAAGERWWTGLEGSYPDVLLHRWGQTELTRRLLTAEGRDVRFAYFGLEDPTVGMRIAPPVTVSAADPYTLGVTPPAGTSGVPDYVPRDSDGVILDAIERRRFVLVDGDSATGKTRTVLEALKRCRPDDEIVAPEPADLKALVARVGRVRDPSRTQGLVLWLDDLDEYLSPAGLSPTVVEKLLDDGVKIVATIRRSPSEQLRAKGGRASAVLDMAHQMRLRARPSVVEREAFAVHHPRRHLGAQEGIGEHFVAARNIQDRYVTASDDAIALTAMLIDWRRVTNAPSMRGDAARSAFLYGEPTDDDFRRALKEATAERRLGDALILSACDALTVPDFLLDFDDARDASGAIRRDASPQTLRSFVGVATPDEAAAIAQTAIARGLVDVASAALEAGMSSDDPYVRGWARVQLGALQASTAPDVARALWMDALEQGDAMGVLEASRRLMRHAADQGEAVDDELSDAIRHAVLNVHPDSASVADALVVVLASQAELRGDLATLKELFQSAKGEVIASVGLRYARAAVAGREMDLARDVIEDVLDQANEVVRARALILRAGFLNADGDRERALDDVLEAIDLTGLRLSSTIYSFVYELRDSWLEERILRKLALAGDADARSTLEFMFDE